ncbi:MAG: hypothetical protein BMS9Abin23_1151 [Thermodesulfobacteriota bacterium]|nr:MAG: hypothetical protein BMS9Abin23_1151 [Thermodesulfobacteriota bacterium]
METYKGSNNQTFTHLKGGRKMKKFNTQIGELVALSIMIVTLVGAIALS